MLSCLQNLIDQLTTQNRESIRRQIMWRSLVEQHPRMRRKIFIARPHRDRQCEAWQHAEGIACVADRDRSALQHFSRLLESLDVPLQATDEFCAAVAAKGLFVKQAVGQIVKTDPAIDGQLAIGGGEIHQDYALHKVRYFLAVGLSHAEIA